MSNIINPNYLQNNTFEFKLKRIPYVEYYGKGINLPGFNVPSVKVPTPFVAYPEPGDHINFEDLSVTFDVDEDLRNYFEIFKWIKETAPTKSFKGYGERKNKLSENSLITDASLFLMTSHKNPNIEIKFYDIFPTTISALNFSVETQEVTQTECTAVFEFSDYDIIFLN